MNYYYSEKYIFSLNVSYNNLLLITLILIIYYIRILNVTFYRDFIETIYCILFMFLVGGKYGYIGVSHSKTYIIWAVSFHFIFYYIFICRIVIFIIIPFNNFLCLMIIIITLYYCNRFVFLYELLVLYISVLRFTLVSLCLWLEETLQRVNAAQFSLGIVPRVLLVFWQLRPPDDSNHLLRTET